LQYLLSSNLLRRPSEGDLAVCGVESVIVSTGNELFASCWSGNLFCGYYCIISGVLAAAYPSHWQLQLLQFANDRPVCVIIGRQVYSFSHPVSPLQKMLAFQLFEGIKST